MPQQSLIFTFFAAHPLEVQALAMARSIRQFTGRYANAPIWIFHPVDRPLQGKTLDALLSLDVSLFSLPDDPTLYAFPYASKPIASAAAEAKAEGKTDILVWIDRDGLVVNEPAAFDLPDGIQLGYRPTDIRNVGSPWGEPLTPLWHEIYVRMGITPDIAWPFTSVVDQLPMYPYFNAGLLCVRPEAGLLRQWERDFRALYPQPVFQPYIRESDFVRYLLHQVILTGTILKIIPHGKMQLLPYGYNYPANLHHRFLTGRELFTLRQAVSVRIDDLLAQEGWRQRFAPDDNILLWLQSILQEFGDYYGRDVETQKQPGSK
ncbi:MAG: hypothetical protein HPY85_10965 [Anaerolineae bacterium]|nr:hypothetical protein [Anaerolineae bacterium]